MSSLIFKGDNLCGDDNGMCTHYCFPLPAYDSTSKSTKIGCMCPDFFILKVDNKTCTEIGTCLRQRNYISRMTPV